MTPQGARSVLGVLGLALAVVGLALGLWQHYPNSSPVAKSCGSAWSPTRVPLSEQRSSSLFIAACERSIGQSTGVIAMVLAIVGGVMLVGLLVALATGSTTTSSTSDR